MIDLEDGDQVLNLAGIGLGLLLAIALVTFFFAATGQQASNASEAPAVDWNLERVNETHVRLSHGGGEPVRTEKLSVTVDGTARHPRWTAPRLTEGEHGIFRAESPSDVVLLWQQSEVERVALGEWRSV